MHSRKRTVVIALSFLAIAVWSVCIIAIAAGRLLVVDRPEHSDVIVVLFGGGDDIREKHGLTLLRSGYAKELILEARDSTLYGKKEYEQAQDFLRDAAPDQAGHVHVCKFFSDSTRTELRDISKCVNSIAPGAHSGIIVTSSYHTRRAVAIARHVLPQFRWSVAAASDPQFDVKWWNRREYARTLFTEWQKLLWWIVFEQWTAKQTLDA